MKLLSISWEKLLSDKDLLLFEGMSHPLELLPDPGLAPNSATDLFFRDSPRDLFAKDYQAALLPKLFSKTPFYLLPPDALEEKKSWSSTLTEILPEFADLILSLDVDFFNLPVNRGTGLSRFSEYSPRDEPNPSTNLDVRPGTLANAHGEIRPIRGKAESWITRFGWDFVPNVYYTGTGSLLPNLEIDGAGAVDPPRIEYDFSKGRKAVLSMSGGDYSYENPQVSGGPERTPFDAVIDPPSEFHNYWMLRFNPITDTLVASLMEAATNGSWDPVVKAGMGALLLWAYLPTEGLTDPQSFEKLHIPYNTFPRRPGDMLRLFSPLFHPELREKIRRMAPFFNPNKEFLGPDGVRYPMPEIPEERARIDHWLAASGREINPRTRGSIIDWAFSDIAKDPERLLSLEEMPQAVFRIRMREGVLTTPFGKIHTDPKMEIRLKYHITPVENIERKRWEARIGMSLEIDQVRLTDLDLKLGGSQLKADHLQVGKLVVELPSLPGVTRESLDQRLPWKVRLMDVRGKGLQMETGSGRLMATQIQIDSAEITGKEEEILSVELPEIRSRIGLNLKMSDQRTQLKLDGSTVLRHFFFKKGVGGRNSIGMEISGDIQVARLSHPSFGWIQFIPAQGRNEGFPISGYISSPQLPSQDGVSSTPAKLFALDLTLPSVGLESEGAIRIPPGTSSLQDGHLLLSGTPGLDLEVSGRLDVREASHRGTELMQWGRFVISPHVSHMNIRGDFAFKFSPDGFSLRPNQEGGEPIRFNCSLDGSRVLHQPNLQDNPLARLPESEVIQTDILLESAKLNISEIGDLEVRRLNFEGESLNKVIHAQGRGISIYDIHGAGTIWGNLLIWGFVRGLFPAIGGSFDKNKVKPPDSGRLLRHLSEAKRAELLKWLGTGDYLHIDEVSLEAPVGGELNATMRDLLINLRESGGREQFTLLRVPEFGLRVPDKSRSFVSLPRGIYADIFLSAPERGGYFRIKSDPGK